MATNRTFTMIKPEAVENGHTGAILKMINDAGFRIVALKKKLMGIVSWNVRPSFCTAQSTS